MKKTLLATTALVGASLLAAPANAGTVGSRDQMNVTLGGIFWFSAYLKDEDVSTLNRGVGFTVSESEVWFGASATADNGIKYGVNIELNGGAADGTAADEAWAFLDSDAWGRIELGDQDDATNRMQLGAWNAAKGAGGPFGGLGDLNTVFGGAGSDALQARADWQVLTTSDATKATYFSPRFSGFQIGASWTPDSGAASGGAAVADSDSDGDLENVFGVSANYVGKFDNVGVGVSVGWEGGTDETAGGAENEDLSVFGVGGRVDFAGFTVGAHYRDYGDTFLTAAQTAAGADSGNQWSVGAGYQAGPWGVSAWYLKGEKDNSTLTSAAGATDTEIVRYGLGAGYAVAPGWALRAELTFLKHDNPTTAAGVGGTTDNDAKGFLLVNRFRF
jgi:predicted porin